MKKPELTRRRVERAQGRVGRCGLLARITACLVAGAALPHLAAKPQAPTSVSPEETPNSLRVRISWGYTSPRASSFVLKFQTNEMVIAQITPHGLEPGDTWAQGICRSRAGGGDVDGLDLTLHFASRAISSITNLHSLWRHLLEHGDSEAAQRLWLDPAFRPDPRKLTVQLDHEGTKGFSVTVDQLLQSRVFWVPELDVFLCAGEPFVSFASHQTEIEPWWGRRTLDQVRAEPEASYEQFAARWADLGSPVYRNPAAAPPGHIVCLTWDSAIPKFGIDRGAGVWNDYGNPDRFRFWLDIGELSQLTTQSWRGQQLTRGLPVVMTTFERDGVRWQVEQFAYPLHGPPPERCGDISMVLLQKVLLNDLTGRARPVAARLTHHRRLPQMPRVGAAIVTNGPGLLLQDAVSGSGLLSIQGDSIRLVSDLVQGAGTNTITISLDLPAGGSREFIVKLPSPVVPLAERARLLALDYVSCREATLSFWSDQLAGGAQFEVPEAAVNTLFRASLWHALRLPRRHGGAGPGVRIDLPYSNFAYDQTGTPWPVNQAVYVDYMLYDLRGHHDISAEELATMYRNNQEPSGHVGGFANWGVYTPAMLYAVSQHYLLSGDRASFEALLPQTLRALDWCLSEMHRASERGGAASGLVLAPLNDLSHDAGAWAFNQSYLFAGTDLLGQALAEIRHPRAAECRAAAQAFRNAVQRDYARASVQAPLVQLRDRTWIPYVPGEALTPRRLPEVWYPTDVDTGALHLTRLKALDPHGLLTTCLLYDHEDNLFFNQWGMANEPVYNQHATAYLLRDEVKPAIRAFYSMLACAFSHSAFESVEHRWGWGQYFCPPSTDGAWFGLYRHMLIHERDDGSLLLCQATPRKWLEDGKQIRVERAPTYYGPLSLTVNSRVARGEISLILEAPLRKPPTSILVRLRHPEQKRLRFVSMNGKRWKDFDPQQAWIRIPKPTQPRYAVIAYYSPLTDRGSP